MMQFFGSNHFKLCFKPLYKPYTYSRHSPNSIYLRLLKLKSVRDWDVQKPTVGRLHLTLKRSVKCSSEEFCNQHFIEETSNQFAIVQMLQVKCNHEDHARQYQKAA